MPAAPIYVPDDATPINLAAANTLADAIRDVSGLDRPSVVQQPSADPVPRRCIKVGYPHTVKPWESVIKCRLNSPLEIYGDDSTPADYVGKFQTETDFQVRAGTHHAVMEFIERYLGVIWAWPGELGKVTPSKAGLVLKPFTWRHVPKAIFRNPLRYSAPGYQKFSTSYGQAHDWSKWHRGFYCLTDVRDATAFAGFYDLHHPDGDPGGSRPELFALQPDGSRSGYPFGSLAKMEVGEPDLVQAWWDDYATGVLTANPADPMISCAFTDSHSRGHSVDPRALAMDYTGTDAEPWLLTYEDGGQEYVALTDREIRFANACAEKLAETNPDKFVKMFAYGPTRPAPKEAELHPNVIVYNVANDFNDPGHENGIHRQRMDDWLKVAGNQVWRPNLGRGHGAMHGLFMTQARQIGARLKEIIPRGCIGFWPDLWWEHWANHWVVYLVVQKLLWDHRQSIDKILNDAYSALFGDAAHHVAAYYDATEARIVEYRVHSIPVRDIPKLWNQDTIDTLQGHLDAALAAVSPGTDEYKRVEWVQAGLDWCKAIITNMDYLRQREEPAVVTNEANIATDDLATDTDGVTGWLTAYQGSPAPTSQQAETNGSTNAWRCYRAADGVFRMTYTVPGTADAMYLLSVDVKHGGDGVGFIFRLLDDDRWTYAQQPKIDPTQTEWATARFVVYGGERIELRNENDGAWDSGAAECWLDNLKIQAAEPVDPAPINTAWQAHTDAAIAALDAGGFDLRPIGSAIEAGGRKLGPTDPIPSDPAPGFE